MLASKGSLVLLLVCFIANSYGALFFVDHVHFIQSLNGNYLFRGGNPNFLAFEYDALVGEMKNRAADSNVTLPKDFYLLDINLENPNSSYDSHHIKTETDFFSKNENLGAIYLHTILGEETSPYEFDNTSYVQERALTFAQWSRDNLPAFVEKIRGVQEQSYPTPVVSYIHCECGCDRTGEVSGSYYMAYMNMSLHDAHALDEKIAGREILPNNHNALDWYCFYLKYAQNYNLTCEP